MWLNSSLREEPYPGLDMLGIPVKAESALRGALAQVLHGCRQLVS